MFPDGKSCVGGQPFQQMEEGKKKRRSEKWWDAQAQSVFLLHDLDALPQGAQDAVHRCE